VLWYNIAILSKGRALKTPKGFGKRYFTLASIQAHSVAHSLCSRSARVDALECRLQKERESDEQPPDDPESVLACLADAKPCHCNCYYNRRTRRTLLRSKHLCYSQCNCRFYSFRRTGVHPPRS
jgi:hypothetical protein